MIFPFIGSRLNIHSYQNLLIVVIYCSYNLSEEE